MVLVSGSQAKTSVGTVHVQRRAALNINEQPAAPAASSAPVGPDWVPATAFLAADHLEALLVRNLMPRLAEEARGSGSSDDSGATSSEGKDEEDQADGDCRQQQQRVIGSVPRSSSMGSSCRQK